MILSPTQHRVLTDSLALGMFLESDERLTEKATAYREAAAALIDLVQELAEKEELSAPF